MREYYGELSNCFEYIEDKNHKAIPWKDYEFSFKFHNNTKYILELKRGKSCHSFAAVKPKEKIEIQVNKWGDGEIFVQAKEATDLKCNFEIERGCMIKRNLVKHVKDKVYIAPIFKSGIVTIVTCDNCGPDLGEKKQYKISLLKETYIREDEIPFDFSRRRMSVVLRDKNDKRQLITKGAVDEQNMVLIGFVGFLDPPKESAKQAINALKKHGVDTVVLTGDSEGVAVNVCKKVGISTENCLTGKHIECMTDNELKELELFHKL